MPVASSRSAIPPTIYERPATRFVAEFIGRMNLFSGQVTSARSVRTARGLEIGAPVPDEFATGAAVHVAVRPERARLLRDKPADGLALRGTLRQVLYLGATREFHVDLDGGERGIVEMPNDGTAPRVRDRRRRVARSAVRELPRAAAPRAISASDQTSAACGRKTARSAMIGTSPSSVVRCMCR